MPVEGRAIQDQLWQATQARVGPTLLEANAKLLDQLQANREALMLKAWPEQARHGLHLEEGAVGFVQLAAGAHTEATGRVWRWPAQAVALPQPLTSAVYFLCASTTGALTWQVRVPANTLTVLGYVLLDLDLGELVALRAIKTLTWHEHDAQGQLLKASEGLHDWVVREEFYSYDAEGRIQEIVAIEPEKTHVARYAFDAQGRLIEVRRSTTRTEPFLLDGLYRFNGALFFRGTV